MYPFGQNFGGSSLTVLSNFKDHSRRSNADVAVLLFTNTLTDDAVGRAYQVYKSSKIINFFFVFLCGKTIQDKAFLLNDLTLIDTLFLEFLEGYFRSHIVRF